MTPVGKLESPAIRWGIAFLFLGVELLLFVVFADLRLVNQVVVIPILIVLFAIIPPILKESSEKETTPIESTQQRRAAFVASAVDRTAKILRIEKIAPVISWIAAVFLVLVGIGTISDSLSGLPIRNAVSAALYVLLAAFAAPPVRGHLHKKYQMEFSRSVVVLTLIAGVLLNEWLVAVPEASPAVILACPGQRL